MSDLIGGDLSTLPLVYRVHIEIGKEADDDNDQ
jgi:hypothetical protein